MGRVTGNEESLSREGLVTTGKKGRDTLGSQGVDPTPVPVDKSV